MPENSQENIEQYNNNPILITNLQIIESSFIPNAPIPIDDNGKEINERILGGERMYFNNFKSLMTGIKIVYETQSGKICRPDFEDPSIQDGQYSIIRTWLIHEKSEPPKYQILLSYPKGSASPHALEKGIKEQLSGEKEVDPLEAEGNRILPERMNPEDIREYGSNIQGKSEPWGKSDLIKNPADAIIFHTIETFNRKYGPSLTEQLFRGLNIKHTPDK